MYLTIKSIGMAYESCQMGRYLVGNYNIYKARKNVIVVVTQLGPILSRFDDTICHGKLILRQMAIASQQ